MTKLILMTALLLSGTAASAAVNRAKIAELACHRLGRLVDTGDIEDNYVARFHKLEITALTQSRPTDPAFKVVASQVPPAQGNAHNVVILMSDAGRALSNNEVRGEDSAGAPAWQGTDPLSLTEAALHVVYDSRDAIIQPFKTGTSAITITQARDSAGNTIGQVRLASESSEKVLEMDVSFQSEVLGFRLVNP